jgi:deoxyribose-phosphate aldolase
MSDDLLALARRIAAELAEGDLAKTVWGGPPTGKNTSPRVGLEAKILADGDKSPRLRDPSRPSTAAGVSFSAGRSRIADYIDHTLLKAEATRADIEQLCDEAREHQFAAICVNPVWVPLCVSQLEGRVAVATVIGFPLGANTVAAKRGEAERAVQDGANELDMVAAVGHIKSGEWGHVADDIAAVVAGGQGRLVKVIIESAALTPVEIVQASALAREMGAHYVKTSTGFHPAGGASAEAVTLMRLTVGDALGVKASGGVRDCDAALRMIAAGATRIGTSSGVSMVKCLGPGPLPLQDLLALAGTHGSTCSTCRAGTPSQGNAY